MDRKSSSRAKASRNRESLLRAISELESRLADLEEQRAALSAELTTLRASLATTDVPANSSASNAPSPERRSVADRVSLFRRLFAGRADVFPKHWHNPRSNKTGYSPACGNEWVRGVCDKPRVKCGECPNQAFIPVSDHGILDHLRGRNVIGVYPMLEDERCHFLAVDFDKDGWK